MNTKNGNDMPLTDAVRQWLKSQGWDVEIEVSDDGERSVAATQVGIDEQSHRIFLESEESFHRFFVYVYTPFNVPASRMDVMARVVNRVNCRLPMGRLGCVDDGESNPVQFKVAIDVEGSTLTPEQVHTMVGTALEVYGHFGSLLAATALTKKSLDQLWQDFEQEVEEDEEGPETL